MSHAEVIRLIAVPLIAAATGYITNWLAVRMLFRPRQPRRILGFSWQGLIPRRRGDIAHAVAGIVSRHLLSHDDIRQAMARPEVANRVRDVFNVRFDEFVERTLKGLNPMVAMLMSADMVMRLKSRLMEEAIAAVGPTTEAIVDSLEEHLDYHALIVQRIEGFDIARFEEIVLRIAGRELRAIEILGGVLGLAIGLLTDLLLLF